MSRPSVEVTLDDFDTQDLIEELEERGQYTGDKSWPAIRSWLAGQGCPRDLLERLDAWQREPVANEARLRAWMASVAAAGHGEGRQR